MLNITPKVFVSYSWDSEDHKSWVRELATRLVTNGVDVRLDDWHVAPGESLTQFMELQIRECDFVLVICTPNYASRSVERKGGVGYEQQIISGSILAGSERKKFIPILREGMFEVGPRCGIPPHFLGTRALDYRETASSSSAFETVLRTIYNEPALYRPELGRRPDFGSTSGAQLSPIRLATIQLDGWQLISGVASSEQSPATFHIPTEEQRRNLEEGCSVKLMFAISIDRNDNDTIIERMWVRVTGERGPYLTGLLANTPGVVSGFKGELEEEKLRQEMYGITAEQLQYEPYLNNISDERLENFNRFKLRHGAEVVFLPEHILDILTVEELAEIEMEHALEPGEKHND